MIDDLIYDKSQKNQINKKNCIDLYKLGFFIHLQNLTFNLQSSKHLENEESNYD